MALDFTTWCGFNFRSTQANATDGANEIGIYGAPSTQTFNGDYGLTNPNSFPANDTTNTDRRVRGRQTFSSNSATFAIAAPNGGYDMRLAYGALTTAGTRTGCVIVDTLDSGFRGTGVSGFLSASGSVSINQFYLTSDSARVYKCTTAGTYTGDPVGTAPSGIQAGTGTARFGYIGEVLHIFETGASPTLGGHNVVDVDNTVDVAGSAWPTAGGTQPKQKSITIANSGITICKHPSASLFLCHIALQAQSTPLEDAIFYDRYGNIVAAPTFCAGEPAGTPLFRLNFAVGTMTPSAIAVTGALAPYVETATVNGQLWVIAGALRIPDSLAGSQTLGIVQTDPSSSVSGSPYTTTVTATVVSSQGRDTSTSIYGLICTDAALIRKTVADAHAAGLWAGYQNQSFTTGNDLVSTSGTDFTTKWNGITPDGTSWYRIRCQDGTYDQTVSLSAKDFGSGGLLVEPYPGHDPEINLTLNAGIRVFGLHMRDLKMPGYSATASSINWRFVRSGNNRCRVKLENLRLGYMFHSGATEANIEADRGGGVSYGPTSFYVSGAESFEMTDCVADGCNIVLSLFDARIVSLTNNRRQRCRDDMFAFGMAAGVDDPVGILADEHCYIKMKGNLPCREIDYAGYSNSPHMDFWQTRPWAAGNSIYGAQKISGKVATNWVVGDKCCTDSHWYTVSAISTGVAGGTTPTHTSGSVVDGGVTWDYGGVFNPDRTFYLDMEENYVISGKELDGGTTGTAFLIDSNADFGQQPFIWQAAIYNNFSSISTNYGISLNLRGAAYIERNVFAGTHLDVAGASFLPQKITGLHDELTIFDRNNIVNDDSSGQQLGSFDTLVVPFDSTAANPGTYLRGTFAQSTVVGGHSCWLWTIDDDTDVSTAAIKTRMRSQLLARSGVDAGPVMPGGLARNTGLSLGLRLGP